MSGPNTRTSHWYNQKDRTRYHATRNTEWTWSHAEQPHDGGSWDSAIRVTIVGVCDDLLIPSRDAVWTTRDAARDENLKLARMVAGKLQTDVPAPLG